VGRPGRFDTAVCSLGIPLPDVVVPLPQPCVVRLVRTCSRRIAGRVEPRGVDPRRQAVGLAGAPCAGLAPHFAQRTDPACGDLRADVAAGLPERLAIRLLGLGALIVVSRVRPACHAHQRPVLQRQAAGLAGPRQACDRIRHRVCRAHAAAEAAYLAGQAPHRGGPPIQPKVAGLAWARSSRRFRPCRDGRWCGRAAGGLGLAAVGPGWHPDRPWGARSAGTAPRVAAALRAAPQRWVPGRPGCGPRGGGHNAGGDAAGRAAR